jgi:CheY-like chemotaxis protein
LKNKANILVVDDDMENTETLSDILTALGHHVEIANDGFKAIQRVKAQVFDVILMDIKMPGINGVETYKEVKHIQPKVVVMMMTAYSVEELAAEALREGAYGVLYKPFDTKKLLQIIDGILAAKTKAENQQMAVD